MADSVPAHDGYTGTLRLHTRKAIPTARPATSMHPAAYSGAAHGSYRKKTSDAGRQRDTFMRRPSLRHGMEPPPSKMASTS